MNDMISNVFGNQRPQSSLQSNPFRVNQALTQSMGVTPQLHSGDMNSPVNAGDFTMGGLESNQLGGNNPFGMEQLGKGVGIAGDLFGMYNQYQAMKMAKNQMNNQAKTSNYNMANNTNFKNSTASVFGSGQPQIQNQFAKMA